MSVPEKRDLDILENVLPRYRAEGFDVYVNPSPSILPPFMQAYRPDAVALKPDRKIAIEVVRSNRTSPLKLKELNSLFAPHHDWELRVIYDLPLSPEMTPDVASRAAIYTAIQRVLNLKKDGHLLPGLIMAWATLEAVARALMPDEFRRPQTPSRLIEVLAQAGYLTPKEADLLRPMILLRNAAVHGSVDPAVDEKQLEQFVTVLRTLADFLSEDRTTDSQ